MTITPNPGRTETVSFSIDTSTVNGKYATADWNGIFFDDTIGIWFHPSMNTNITYNGLDITSYSGSAGWYDVGDEKTSLIPLPGTLLSLGLGLLGFGFRKTQA